MRTIYITIHSASRCKHAEELTLFFFLEHRFNHNDINPLYVKGELRGRCT